MTINQHGLAETARKAGQLIFKQPMVRAMNLVNPPLQLRPVDPPTPQRAVAMGARRDKAKAISGTRPNRGRRNALDGGGVHLFLSAIAVDDGARDVLDNCRKSGADCSPAEAIDKWVLERFQRTLALRRIGQNGGIIIAARMGHGQ